MKRTRSILSGRPAIVPVLIYVYLMLGVVACQKAPAPEEEQAVSPEALLRHETEVQTWHDERLASLHTEDGWLSLVGLSWLEAGDNSVGSEASSTVILPASVPEKLATIRLNRTDDGAEATLVAEVGETLEVGGQLLEASASVPLASDVTGDPTVVSIGTVSFYVIDRDGQTGVRAKDSASPVRSEFEGIERFPVSWDWRVVSQYTPRAEPLTVEIPTALGTVSQMASPGRIHFEHDGQSFELDAFETGDRQEVWFVFGDQSNAKTTYGGGRFLYARFDEGDASQAGNLVVDFNRAYNPPCVFTPYATCPLPTPENRLALAVEAGEKTYGIHH